MVFWPSQFAVELGPDCQVEAGSHQRPSPLKYCLSKLYDTSTSLPGLRPCNLGIVDQSMSPWRREQCFCPEFPVPQLLRELLSTSCSFKSLSGRSPGPLQGSCIHQTRWTRILEARKQHCYFKRAFIIHPQRQTSVAPALLSMPSQIMVTFLAMAATYGQKNSIQL